MFTGITESTAAVLSIETLGSGKKIRFRTNLDETIEIDQSISHDGVCLTVTEIFANIPGQESEYSVVAVEETLKKTRLGKLITGEKVNLERSIRANQRLDGHFVLGHIDTTGILETIEDRSGSWNLRINFPNKFSPLLVPKGSVCLNGVSLTVVACGEGWLSVTVIPYTWENTNLGKINPGNEVNIEFDILGKYILQWKG